MSFVLKKLPDKYFAGKDCKMDRKKRSIGKPALILISNQNSVTNGNVIPKVNYIDSEKYTIGRNSVANLIIHEASVSRDHCYLEKTASQWRLHANGKGVSVSGTSIPRGESECVECGDKIKVNPLIVFEFKCSPDDDLRCCRDSKRTKYSDEENECEQIPQVSVLDLPETIPLSQLQDSSDLENSFKKLNETKHSIQKNHTISLSQLHDSSDLEDSFTKLTETKRSIQKKHSFMDLASDENTDFVPSIRDIKDSIKQYSDYIEAGTSNQRNDDVYGRYNQKLVEELKFRLRCVEKMDDFTNWISYEKNPRIDTISEKLSDILREKSKLQEYEYNLRFNGREKDLSQILFKLDPLLKKNLKTIFDSVCKALNDSCVSKSAISSDCEQISDLRKPSNSSASTQTSDQGRKIDVGISCDLIFANLDSDEFTSFQKSALENELKKQKDQVKYYQIRENYFEMKLKEQEKLADELKATKLENESLMEEVKELKDSLGNKEIIELELQYLQETTKYKDEDKRSKDVLERKVQDLTKDNEDLKEENTKLSAEKSQLKDEIALYTVKCEDLQKNIEQKSMEQSRFKEPDPKCGGEKPPDEEFCCDVVKELKGSLIDLLESDFQCSICGDFFVGATVTNCNHVFCTLCLDEWKKKKKQCPFCRCSINKEVKVTIVDEFITNFLKVVSYKMFEERASVITERSKPKTSAPKRRSVTSRRVRALPRAIAVPAQIPPNVIVDLSGM